MPSSAQLPDLRRRATEYVRRDGQVAEDEYFFAEQNARLVRNAEQYYRAMFGGRAESWNLRDTHMMETVEALMEWTRRRGGAAKAVVSAHNSHLGDARATQMADWGELNLGQPVRQRYGREAPARLERAIGVVYRPETERASHDFRARLSEQFDAVIHVDTTRALSPLERWSHEEADLPETYPVGV